MKMSKHVAV